MFRSGCQVNHFLALPLHPIHWPAVSDPPESHSSRISLSVGFMCLRRHPGGTFLPVGNSEMYILYSGHRVSFNFLSASLFVMTTFYKRLSHRKRHNYLKCDQFVSGEKAALLRRNPSFFKGCPSSRGLSLIRRVPAFQFRHSREPPSFLSLPCVALLTI